MPLLTGYLRRRRYDMVQPYLQGRVLDIGCGNAARDLALQAVERYVGLDCRLDLLTHMRRRFPQHEFSHCDLDRDPLPVDVMAFDTVLMVAVVEHLADPGRVMDQVAGHLWPEGRLVITTPTPWGDQIHRLGTRLGLFHPHAAEEHRCAYDRRRLETLLTSHGLSIMRYQPFELGANQLVVCRGV